MFVSLRWLGSVTAGLMDGFVMHSCRANVKGKGHILLLPPIHTLPITAPEGARETPLNALIISFSTVCVMIQQIVVASSVQTPPACNYVCVGDDHH